MEKLNPNWGDNIDQDVFSGGLAIEPLRESMEKLSYVKQIEKLLIEQELIFHKST